MKKNKTIWIDKEEGYLLTESQRNLKAAIILDLQSSVEKNFQKYQEEGNQLNITEFSTIMTFVLLVFNRESFLALNEKVKYQSDLLFDDFMRHFFKQVRTQVIEKTKQNRKSNH